ncbi:MAG: SDR family NAD(P)-dependent oxidoreductase [Candidatus Helarchaeota archaeon]|nr:SDR family NAD(P)-dependent oxidoreductase [Candidatus Helarchaeota archaeon]
MVDKLKGESAIITGGAQGIGKAIALKFAEEGANILIMDLDTDKANETAKECKNKNPNVKVAVVASRETGDIVKYENCEAAVSTAKKELGGVTILINNAGLTLDKPAHTLSEAWWDIVINVVLVGSFNMIKAVAPVMQEQKYGCIWNVSSVAGIQGNAAQINYASAKAGLVGLTKTAARELASDNIAVNVVGFSAVWTRLVAPHGEIDIMGQKMVDMKMVRGKDPNEVKNFYKAGIPMCKHREDPLLPEDVANFFASVCQRDAHYMTGQWMIYSGGLAL